MILLLGMVPISLYVTLEIVKFLQRFLMMLDLRMYWQPQDQAFIPRTTALNEELGQVDYIFSDNPNPNPNPKQMIDHNCKFLDAAEERVLKARAGGAARLKRD